MARIVIDARLAGTQHAGIGRYVEELVRELIEIKPKRGSKMDHLVVVLRHPGQLDWLEKIQSNSLSLVYRNIPHYSVAEQLVMPFVFWALKPDLLHVPHFNLPVFFALITRIPVVVTIHDLLWHEQRDSHATTLHPLMHLLKHKVYVILTNLVIRSASVVIVPSERVKHEVLEKTHPRRVEVVLDGVKELFFGTEDQQSSFPAPTKKSFLIAIGSAYPHKNLEYLLEIMTHLPAFELVLCSARSVFLDALRDTIKHKNLSVRVHILEHPTDRQLKALLHRSKAFITVSKSEGFGLPALEAMATGSLVFASDIPVFHELYKSGAVYLSLKDVQQAVSTIQATFSSSLSQQEKQRKQARSIAQAYRWSHNAQRTQRIYHELLEKHCADL